MLASCLIRISLCGFNLTSKSAAIRTPPCKTNFNIFLFVIDLHQVQPEARDEIQEIQGIALSDFTSMPVLADKIAQASDTKQMALQQNAYSLRPSEFFDFFDLIFFSIFLREEHGYDHWMIVHFYPELYMFIQKLAIHPTFMKFRGFFLLFHL